MFMTAALENLTGPPVRARSRARGTRVLAVLGIVLPVPLLAALGLSLPLPATVERLAAKLVPFGDSGALDPNSSRALARGSIVLAPGEQGVGRVGATPSSGSPVSRLRPRTASSPATAVTASGGRASDNATHRGSTPSAPGSSGAVAKPAPPGVVGPAPDPQPAPPPPPPGPPPVIATVTTATSTATATVNGAASAATGALGGIKPP
jgi:hypothetical protein